MPRYYVARVELHEAHPDQKLDYKRLHDEMKTAGYWRTISDGTTEFHMPDATYWAVGEWSPPEAQAKGMAAAKIAAKDYSVIVVETITRPTWHLKPVKK